MVIRLGTVSCSVVLGVILVACAPRESLGQQETICIVSRIVDGDTFHCSDGGRIRLIGIDSPERGQRPFGGNARNALLEMIPPGTAVRLQGDVTFRDRYGRRLAYVWVGSTLVNEAMVQNGWAVLYTVPPNVKYAERFARAQNEARATRAGLWSQRGFECLPGDFRRRVCVSR
jgi:micrococcal nuclease